MYKAFFPAMIFFTNKWASATLAVIPSKILIFKKILCFVTYCLTSFTNYKTAWTIYHQDIKPPFWNNHHNDKWRHFPIKASTSLHQHQQTNQEDLLFRIQKSGMTRNPQWKKKINILLKLNKRNEVQKKFSKTHNTIWLTL